MMSDKYYHISEIDCILILLLHIFQSGNISTSNVMCVRSIFFRILLKSSSLIKYKYPSTRQTIELYIDLRFYRHLLDRSCILYFCSRVISLTNGLEKKRNPLVVSRRFKCRLWFGNKTKSVSLMIKPRCFRRASKNMFGQKLTYSEIGNSPKQLLIICIVGRFASFNMSVLTDQNKTGI